MQSINGPASLCPDASPTDRGTRVPAECRHSREAFHCLFRMIATRRDVSPIAKLVHQALVSMHRTRKEWTQTEIGEEVGLSRHQVWKGLAELIAGGWVRSKRRGLGLPNQYELLVIDPADLDGKVPKSSGFQPARHQDAGQSRHAPRRDRDQKNPAKNMNQTGIPGTAKCMLCSGRHSSLACPLHEQYGALRR